MKCPFVRSIIAALVEILASNAIITIANER